MVATGLKAIHLLQRVLHFIGRQTEEFCSRLCIEFLGKESLQRFLRDFPLQRLALPEPRHNAIDLLSRLQ
jgi:hypothetical protein